MGSEYEWSGAHGDPYPSGASSHPDPDWDYAFRTIVDKSRPKLKNDYEIPAIFRLMQKLFDRFPLLEQIFNY